MLTPPDGRADRGRNNSPDGISSQRSRLGISQHFPWREHIMRAAFEEGLPLIILQENGFTDLAKPGGQRMEACARGQLLLLAPWQHHNEQTTISRQQCLSLNDMARMICMK